MIRKRFFAAKELDDLIHGPNNSIRAVRSKGATVSAELPDRTRQVAGEDVWVYPKVSRDPATGKVDSETSIYFANGQVTNVLF